jgi:serine/threonine protein kinase
MQVIDGAACLDEELIAAFVVGSLSASERAQVEEHLADCDACLSVVSAAAYGCVADPLTPLSPGDERPGSRWTRPPAWLDMQSQPSAARALAELHHELLDGALPGRFRLLELLGRGQLGTVWRAHDGVRGQAVALKVLPGVSGRERVRLKTEFRALASLSHPHLVTFHELVMSEQASFISMELVRGVDFLTFHRCGCDAAGRIDQRRLRQTARQLARALEHLHRAGQLHRDVKPANVRVAQQDRVVLLDLGLVWPSASSAAARGAEVAGRFRYTAPEQREGRALTPAADWYAFGLTLHHAITGGLPAGDRRSPARDALGEHVPPELRALISSLLAASPEARPNASEILRCLGADEPV